MPALETAYVLTADRWAKGASLYAQLEAPVDPFFVTFYRFLPAEAPFLLRVWKAWGLLAAGLFFLRTRLLRTPSPLQQALLGGWLVAYALQRWAHPFAIGMPALWTLLLLYSQLRSPFGQGILWAGLSYLFPQTVLWGIWAFYRRIEERDLRALGLFALGAVWALLASLALHQRLGCSEAYGRAYWLPVWQAAYTSWEWLLVFSVGALLVVGAQSGLYFRRPYTERRAYRDRLWAAITSVLAEGPLALGVWMTLGLEPLSDRLRQLAGLVLLALHGGILGYTFARLPNCLLFLPTQSCLWGTPPCYVRLEGPYGCDITSPYRWQRLWSQADWVQLYRSWGEPRFIWDAAQSWAEVQYRLPLRAQPFVQQDTLLPKPLHLYQRR